MARSKAALNTIQGSRRCSGKWHFRASRAVFSTPANTVRARILEQPACLLYTQVESAEHDRQIAEALHQALREHDQRLA